MRLVWDKTGEKRYETGVDRCVLFPKGENGAYSSGVAWNGIIGITQSPSGAEPNPLWADNIKYLNLMSAEEFGASVEAYMSPEEFDECDGTREIAPGVMIGQQDRKEFGLCYRSLVGNDTEGSNYGYKLHLIYGAMASPSEKAHQTVNDSPEAATLSWELTTTPVSVAGFKPTAILTIDSTKCDPAKLKALEDILYGKDGTGESDTGTAPRLPLPDEIATLMKATA